IGGGGRQRKRRRRQSPNIGRLGFRDGISPARREAVAGHPEQRPRVRRIEGRQCFLVATVRAAQRPGQLLAHLDQGWVHRGGRRGGGGGFRRSNRWRGRGHGSRGRGCGGGGNR